MAPNPIDFDKVFSADLSKNFVVLLVVCLLFGLYIVLVVIARRFDKKDLEKVKSPVSIYYLYPPSLSQNFFNISVYFVSQGQSTMVMSSNTKCPMIKSLN